MLGTARKGAIIIPILQISKLRPKKAKYFACTTWLDGVEVECEAQAPTCLAVSHLPSPFPVNTGVFKRQRSREVPGAGAWHLLEASELGGAPSVTLRLSMVQRGLSVS